MDVPAILAFAGVAALLIGFLGGGIKIKDIIEIPSIPNQARMIVSIGGLAFVIVSIWLFSTTRFAPIPADTPLSAVTPAAQFTESLPMKNEELPAATLNISPSSDIFTEDFMAGSRYWETGIKENDQRVASRDVVDGAFRWQVTARDDISTGIGSKLPVLSDFDLEVTLKKVEGSDSLQYGVEFRVSDAGGYVFLIDPDGQFFLTKWSAEEQAWIELVELTDSSSIHLNGENKLRVYAVGSKLRLYINDELVADPVDSSFGAGTIDIAAWLSDGETLTLDMTSFKITLLSP